MLEFIAAIVLLLLALAAITLRKTYYYVPEVELKRQARAGNGLAKTLYRAVAYGGSLRLLLWLLIGVFAACGVTLFVRVAPPAFGILVVLVVLLLGFAWMPSSRLTRIGEFVANALTPTVVFLLRVLNPVFSRLTSLWHRRFPLEVHSGLYEKDDLAELISQQREQTDNRIPEEILELVNRALHFDSYKVRDVLLPRKQLKAVKADELVGPVLLDELHATGQTDFPVYETSKDKVTAVLHVLTLDDAKQGGKVIDYATRKVAYLHESDNLATALHAVYTTKQRLFVVVNSFDEYVGIVTLEDILHVLVGTPAEQAEFDTYLDRQAVASRHDKHKQPEPDMEVLPEEPETVVE